MVVKRVRFRPGRRSELLDDYAGRNLRFKAARLRQPQIRSSRAGGSGALEVNPTEPPGSGAKSPLVSKKKLPEPLAVSPGVMLKMPFGRSVATVPAELTV